MTLLNYRLLACVPGTWWGMTASAGDIHAITAANNLFAAAVDARYFHEQTASLNFIFGKLCPADKSGKRVFENSMVPRLKKLGIATRDPNAMTEDEKRRFCLLDIDPDTITW